MGSPATLRNKTLFITGASRGIGKAIALRAARDGANIVLVAKTKEPHPKLEGTILSVAKEVEAAGGRALPVQCDVRFEAQVNAAVEQGATHFGKLDIVINNASAISLTDTPNTDMKRFDLMHQVNTRATFMVSRACLPFMAEAENPHLLTLSPPLNLEPAWFGKHLPYTLSKFGMSLCVLGLAEELKNSGIAVNALWPRTFIATAAIAHIAGQDGLAQARHPSIVADAAHLILTQPRGTFSGRFCIDEQVLRDAGVNDFSGYAVDPEREPALDLFI